MTSDERALGGYGPEAGRNAHEANHPTLIPVPSLLRSLLSEHLDPGYAAASARRGTAKRNRRAEWSWQLLGGLIIAVVFATAAAQAQFVAPATRASQRVLADGVRTAEESTRTTAERRNDLAAAVEGKRRTKLAGDAYGRQLLADLDAVEFSAATGAVTGPGLTVVVTEPGPARDLTDVTKQRIAGSRQVILDRDLQLVVNSLWGNGAEAIAVGGVRIGPNVTIRQAGGGMLVDSQPIANPYVIIAIGPPHAMRDAFDRGAALARLRLLERSYGVGVTVTEADGLLAPAGSARDVNFAKEGGPP